MTGQRFGSVLLRQATRIGQRRADIAAQRLHDEIGIILPDVRLTRTPGRVRLMGRNLRRRWISNAALRWLGRLLR